MAELQYILVRDKDRPEVLHAFNKDGTPFHIGRKLMEDFASGKMKK